MHPRGVLPRGEQSLQARPALRVDGDPAHVEVGRGGDLHGLPGEVAPDRLAALHHSRELAQHLAGAEVRDVDPDPPVRRPPPRSDLQIPGPRDDVARGALHALGVVAGHVALAEGVTEGGPGPPQALLQDAPGEAGGAGQEPGGVELHHLHVHQAGPRPPGHSHPVPRLLQRRRGDPVHGGPAPGGEQHRPGPHQHQLPPAHVQQEGPGDGAPPGQPPAASRPPPPARRGQQIQGAVLLQAPHAAGEELVLQAPHDLDSGQVAPVHGAVEGLPGERLLVDHPARVAVEEAAVAVLQLQQAQGGLVDQDPGQLLVVEVAPATDGVAEVQGERVAGVEDGVVAPLHHAGAAALGHQALDHHGDVQIGIGIAGVQRGHHPGATPADDQAVSGELLDVPAWSSSLRGIFF